ncbi:MAG: hypothetical protein ACRDGD_09160 [Candidatus Limnocylindria bacterium]
MDDPPPIRRAAVGCLLIALFAIGFMVLVRPAIFSLAPPRDASVTTVATATEVVGGPISREVLLARSQGWDGEVDAGDGRVQLELIVSPFPPGAVSAVSATSPLEDCPIEIKEVQLLDCVGNAWSFDGRPLDPDDPPLDRFPTRVENGSVIVDLTRVVGE